MTQFFNGDLRVTPEAGHMESDESDESVRDEIDFTKKKDESIESVYQNQTR